MKQVRVNCLVCLGKILDHLDKWMVIDFILPFLGEIPSRDPAVVMGIVGNLPYTYLVLSMYMRKFVRQ